MKRQPAICRPRTQRSVTSAPSHPLNVSIKVEIFHRGINYTSGTSWDTRPYPMISTFVQTAASARFPFFYLKVMVSDNSTHFSSACDLMCIRPGSPEMADRKLMKSTTCLLFVFRLEGQCLNLAAIERIFISMQPFYWKAARPIIYGRI